MITGNITIGGPIRSRNYVPTIAGPFDGIGNVIPTPTMRFLPLNLWGRLLRVLWLGQENDRQQGEHVP